MALKLQNCVSFTRVMDQIKMFDSVHTDVGCDLRSMCHSLCFGEEGDNDVRRLK
jgi:hypothetical protein